MSKELFLYNKNTREQMFINSARSQEIDKLRAEGWVENPPLVHMHNPQLRRDMNVPVEERKKWESEGYYAEPTMIYHPDKGTKKVSADDAKLAVKNQGWYRSPAEFPGNDIGAIKTPGVSKEAA